MSVSMKSELSNMSREPSSMAFRGMGSGDMYVGGEEKEKEWRKERSGGRREGVEEGEKEGRKERRRGGKRREEGGKEVRNIAKTGGTPPPYLTKVQKPVEEHKRHVLPVNSLV